MKFRTVYENADFTVSTADFQPDFYGIFYPRNGIRYQADI